MKAKTSAILGVVVGRSLMGVLVMPVILEKDRTMAEQQEEIADRRKASTEIGNGAH